MTPTFKDSHLKINRAKTHLAELERAQSEWSGRTQHGKQISPDESHWSVRAAPPPADVGAIVGDIIHNLRAALDLMAVSLVRHKGGNTKNVYFPFADSEEALESRINDKNFRRAGPAAVALLKELAPHKGGNTALRDLHDLDLQDKHHALIPHSVSVTTAAMRIGIDDTTGKVTLAPVEDSKAKSALVFPADSVFANQEMIPVLHKLVETVTGILKAFEALCEPPGPAAMRRALTSSGNPDAGPEAAAAGSPLPTGPEEADTN